MSRLSTSPIYGIRSFNPCETTVGGIRTRVLLVASLNFIMIHESYSLRFGFAIATTTGRDNRVAVSQTHDNDNDDPQAGPNGDEIPLLRSANELHCPGNFFLSFFN